MKRRHKPEQIIHKLRHAEVLPGQGKKTEEVCRDLGISDATYYKWRKEYGGMGVSQAKKQLEVENVRLERVVVDQALNIQLLKDVAEENFQVLNGSGVVWRVPGNVMDCRSAGRV